MGRLSKNVFYWTGNLVDVNSNYHPFVRSDIFTFDLKLLVKVGTIIKINCMVDGLTKSISKWVVDCTEHGWLSGWREDFVKRQFVSIVVPNSRLINLEVHKVVLIVIVIPTTVTSDQDREISN